MSSRFTFWPLKKKSPTKKKPAESESAATASQSEAEKAEAEPSMSSSSVSASLITDERPFRSVGSATQTGFVAFNPGKINQDRHVCLVDFGGSTHHAVFAVFDGHGASGHEVSEFVARVLPLNLIGLVSDCDVHECLRSGFLQTSEALENNKKINSAFSGTTAVLTYLTKEFIITANAGDSRAVLGRAEADGTLTAVALSKDQKPDRDDEKARILRNRGRVQPCRGTLGEPIGPPRVWLPNQDVPGLAMTRSFGDTVAKSIGVNAEPEVEKIPRQKNDRYLIIASDGVWEFISNQEAVDIVSKCPSAPEACLALQKESIKRWKAEEDVIDDITSIVVFL